MPGRNGILKGSSTPVPQLPVVSFKKVEGETVQPAGVSNLAARNYGFNDPDSEFKRPEAYIRYIAPLESEFANQVEYDMDEQDQEWLDQVNSERKKEQNNPVSYETFEIIIDKIEKEWFELVKKLPKPDTPGPSEDSTCAICDDAEVENSNAIVFCDGCNLAVHQECYGVPYIPEGQWLCRKCQLSPEHPVSCVLCPNEGGAFKQTNTGAWGHLLCAMYIAETSVGNSIIQEPIEGVHRIEKARWKLTCTICGMGAGHGACIQCAKTLCYVAYHVTCARKLKLLMPMKGAEGEKLQLMSYCTKHIPPEQGAAHLAALKAEHERDGYDSSSSRDREHHQVADTPKSKSARAYAKSYTLGAPLVPAKIVDTVIAYISKIQVHKKLLFVQMVCRYWSLKREARRGAPLLKRLHLEPWTAGGNSQRLSGEQKAEKLRHVVVLRKDLETVRMITEIVRKREMEKLKQAQLIQELLSELLYPHEPAMRLTFEKITSIDRLDIFKQPVSKTQVPDYYDVVTNPMSWNQIDEKLDKHEYWDLAELKNDVHLVLDNALLYNSKDSPIHRLANRMKAQASIILLQLDRWKREQPAGSGLGDLEPSLGILELLMSKEQIEDQNRYIIDTEPIQSIFNYEIGVEKPKPPPPRPAAGSRKKGAVRDYAAEKARRLERQAAAREAALLDPPPPGTEFRARTRRQAAFVAEASVSQARSTEADGEGEGETTTAPDSPSRRRQRREPAILPGQSVEPPVVDTVSNQQMFRMFDAGWILPTNTRRGGRAAVEKLDPFPLKKRQRTDKGEAPTTSQAGLQSIPTRPRLKGTADPGSDSELSALSDLTSDTLENAEVGDESAIAQELELHLPIDPSAEVVRHLKLKAGERMEGGTLVWARMESYPAWPAVVFDADDTSIPKTVLKARQSMIRKEPGPLHLVRFYDKGSSWQWLEPSRLHLLGEDDDFDASMLAGRTNLQRFRNEGLKAQCRAAYRRAKAEMETEADLVNPPESDDEEEEHGMDVDPTEHAAAQGTNIAQTDFESGVVIENGPPEGEMDVLKECM